MCRIAGRQRYLGVSLEGADGEIPALTDRVSNAVHEAGLRTGLGGRFDWGGRLLNCNGGARRFPHPGWESGRECKGTRKLD